MGYVRKSVSKEGDATREKLLTAMITKLKEKLLCRKVFVSPFSSADKRDKSMKSSKFVESLKRDGTTQGNKIINIFSMKYINQLYIRLVVVLSLEDKVGAISRNQLCWPKHQC